MSLKKKLGIILAGIGLFSGTSPALAENFESVSANEPITLTQDMNQQIMSKLLFAENGNNTTPRELYHYSHSSHASHYSHSSHTSHYSSYY